LRIDVLGNLELCANNPKFQDFIYGRPGHGGHGSIGKFFAEEGKEMANLIPFPDPGAETRAQAETESKLKLFAWADALLRQLGLTARVALAQSVSDLRKITLNVDDVVEIDIAIRDALHPVTGKRADHFTGLREGALKRLLKMRFNEMKKSREVDLLRGSAGASGGSRSSYNWAKDIKWDDKGNVRPILSNLILYLREHSTWKGLFGFDEFNLRVVIRKRPPWGDELPDAALTDHHESHVRIWFEGEDIIAAHGNVGRAIQAAARANRFNPVRDHFDALVWDGEPRLDTWLSTYLHVDDTPYARAVGPRYIISGVARIYDPGCQVDHMLVLEAPQGRGKSTSLRTLAVRDAWFTDRLSHISSKDAAQELAGVLIIEISEMDALRRVMTSASKSYITRRDDRYRPPYAKHVINQPRQCIFAGTINPPAGGYLKDATGSRRTWPVCCHGMIDLEALARDCDQLWAEAIVRFKAGAKWHLETPELEALATAEQAMRYEVDAWQEPIEKYLGERKDTSVGEILEKALGFKPKDQTSSAEKRVVKILTRLGFTRHRPRGVKGARTRDGRKKRYWR
jgi:predicted P-loop ATPase